MVLTPSSTTMPKPSLRKARQTVALGCCNELRAFFTSHLILTLQFTPMFICYRPRGWEQPWTGSQVGPFHLFIIHTVSERLLWGRHCPYSTRDSFCHSHCTPSRRGNTQSCPVPCSSSQQAPAPRYLDARAQVFPLPPAPPLQTWLGGCPPYLHP